MSKYAVYDIELNDTEIGALRLDEETFKNAHDSEERDLKPKLVLDAVRELTGMKFTDYRWIEADGDYMSTTYWYNNSNNDGEEIEINITAQENSHDLIEKWTDDIL